MKALSGIGLEASAVAPLVVLLPPPPPPVPSPAVVPEPAREVPPAEVFALDEMFVDVLVLESTEAFEVDVLDTAEVEFTFVAPVGEMELAEESAEVDDAVAGTPDVDDAVNIDVAVTAPALAPAPLDEPAVADGVAATVPVPEVVPCT